MKTALIISALASGLALVAAVLYLLSPVLLVAYVFAAQDDHFEAEYGEIQKELERQKTPPPFGDLPLKGEDYGSFSFGLKRAAKAEGGEI